MSDALKIPVHDGPTGDISKGFRLGEKHNLGSHDDFAGVHETAARHHPARVAGMTDKEWREYMKEEQKEKGMHPSLQNKKF
jgi:hypothetical protein